MPAIARASSRVAANERTRSRSNTAAAAAASPPPFPLPEASRTCCCRSKNGLSAPSSFARRGLTYACSAHRVSPARTSESTSARTRRAALGGMGSLAW